MRVYEGKITKGQKIQIMNTKEEHQVLGLMYPHPISPIKSDEVSTGEIGIVITGLKSVDGLQVGDTITDAKNPTAEPMGRDLRVQRPFCIFAGIYPNRGPD